MKKIIYLLVLSFCNFASADDIFLIETKNQCVLLPSNVDYKSYVNKVNKNNSWFAVNSNYEIKPISLKNLKIEQEPCLDTVFINEKDQKKIKEYDFITNQTTNLFPSHIEIVKDLETIYNINKTIIQYLKIKNRINIKQINEEIVYSYELISSSLMARI